MVDYCFNWFIHFFRHLFLTVNFALFSIIIVLIKSFINWSHNEMGSSIYQMSTRSKPCWSKISTLCFLFTFFSFVPSLLTSQIPVITSDQSNAITPLSPSSPSYQSTTLGSNSALFAVETAESPKNSANVLLAPSSYTQSSECALILQRTYVVNLPSESTRSPLFAGFLSVIKQP